MKPWLLAALAWPITAAAQGLVLGGSAPPPSQSCTSATAGTTTSYSCINQQEQALVAQQKTGLAATVPGTGSPPPSLGLYNQAATREQFGTNFGKSTLPQRPPPAVYGTPVMPHR